MSDEREPATLLNGHGVYWVDVPRNQILRLISDFARHLADNTDTIRLEIRLEDGTDWSEPDARTTGLARIGICGYMGAITGKVADHAAAWNQEAYQGSASMSDIETINIATAAGRERLAQLAAQTGPVFKVRHACDPAVEDSAVKA